LAANGSSSNGRINKDYANGNIDVRIVLPATAFGGDAEYVWASAGHAVGFSVSSDSIIEDTARFSANPAISLSDVASGQTLYNRNEASSHTFKIKNASNEDIGITGVWQLRDSTNAVVSSFNLNAVSGTYTGNYTIGEANRATFDLTGDQWNIITNFADMSGSQAGPSNVFSVSRKWQFSTLSNGTINGQIFTGTSHTPTSDQRTEFVYGQTVFFHAYIYNARGTLLGTISAVGFNVRPVGSETYDTYARYDKLTSGEFAGPAALYKPCPDDALGDKTLVLASSPATGSNQPRTGAGGLGNFAETSTVTAEFEVINSYIDGDGRTKGGCGCCTNLYCDLDICSFLLDSLPDEWIVDMGDVASGAFCDQWDGEHTLIKAAFNISTCPDPEPCDYKWPDHPLFPRIMLRFKADGVFILVPEPRCVDTDGTITGRYFISYDQFDPTATNTLRLVFQHVSSPCTWPETITLTPV
jgi:hypothetical protein